MKSKIAQWAGSAGALIALAHALPGFRVVDLDTALVVALAYGVVVTLANVALIPFAYTVFLWVPRPIWNLLCLVLVNGAVMFALAHYVRGFAVDSVPSAVIASVVLAVVSAVLGKLFE